MRSILLRAAVPCALLLGASAASMDATELSLFSPDESPGRYFATAAAGGPEAPPALFAVSPWPSVGLTAVTLRGLPAELLPEFAAETAGAPAPSSSRRARPSSRRACSSR